MVKKKKKEKQTTAYAMKALCAYISIDTDACTYKQRLWKENFFLTFI